MFRRSALIAALFLVLTAATASAGGNTIHITSTHYPPSTANGIGGTITWSNESGIHHTATGDSSVFPWNKDLPNGASQGVLFSFPGSYGFHCNIHPLQMTGKIKVEMDHTPFDGTTATTFTIIVATKKAPTGFAFVIQRKAPGGTWKAFKTITFKRFSFTPSSTGTWNFRAKLKRNSDGAASGYSPANAVPVHA